ncbi:hypothetical protein [Pseudobacteriovorax antillogorgiicola]|uniref:Uncharacterized protein n=1 Tax=Pseudobacteriovorax antillogorgiicola TaxID=1513793 RepID=A0A1Y6BSN0_9BACT|nr:hypothetical protein [Pseudobacteriovorax antillogorgiicola]TCS54714.1 hypothetical protein EDD56_106227 [Pseudobacteriovorax antillogorgiicola]SMF16098.1 hypothetical protein SAMN06296036_10616 [Pseudobacteriovorax antillogorgiicola]
MIRRLRYLLLSAPFWFANLSLAQEPIYVSGVKHTLTEADFEKSTFYWGNILRTTYKAKIPVSGDYGQDMFFDIAGTLEGYGEVLDLTCIWIDGRNFCQSEPLYHLRFGGNLEVKCSGERVGRDWDHTSQPNLHKQDVLQKSRFVINELVNLGGDCKELELNLISYVQQGELDLSILITEQF